MSRQQGVSPENNFIQGLITETTALRFPTNAATETFDCVFGVTGQVSSRLGWDLEDPVTLLSTSIQTNEVFSEFLWNSVAGDGNRTFVVQQKGGTLYFYDVSDSTDVSGNAVDTLLLSTFAVSGSDKLPHENACQFASGTGRLVVTNPACEPFYVEFDPDTLSVTGTSIDIRVRDFLGLNDGLGDDDRPTSTVADLITNNPSHYYNILNQSWFIADALSQWDTARTDLPSNRDYVALYRSSATDAFDNARVTANTPGSRRASRGHFILSAWCPNHTTALSDEGFSGTISSSEIEISFGGEPSIIGDFNEPSAAFDLDTTQIGAECANNTGSSGYIGVSFSSGTRITKAIIHGSTNVGFNNGGAGTTTLTLYGKQGSAPSSSTDGTSLGTTSFTDGADESAGRTITSSDTNTFWNHVWVKVDIANTGIRVAEFRLFTTQQQEAIFCTQERPKCVEFFAGRAWYAGIDFGKLNSKIYFTQIIEEASQFGKCYQKNDPASEDFTDLLADDGGVIVIPEIADVKRLFAFQSGLFVFASNGVWLISGSSGAGFLATDFLVRKITTVGVVAPFSLISVRGSPVWWGVDGIYTVRSSPENNSFEATSITDQKIKSFILDIPDGNIQYIKAAYDTKNAVAYWVFNSVEDADPWTYDSVLVSNGITGAFYPWTISVSDDVTLPVIHGVLYTITPSGTAVLKFPVTININTTTEYLTFAESRNTNYKDWGFYADRQLIPDATIEYTPYFITGFNLDGQGLRYQQPGYIIVFTDNDQCASAFVQGVFDFATSGNSGKWSSRQQVYNPCLDNRSVNYRRLKIRGKGRSMQLKFTGEPGKPFSIIGWMIWKTISAMA